MALCMGVEPIASWLTTRPLHRLRRTAKCGAALLQLAWVSLFVENPPRENRNYTAMGSRKLVVQPLAPRTMAPATIILAAAFLIAVDRKDICSYTLRGHVSAVNRFRPQVLSYPGSTSTGCLRCLLSRTGTRAQVASLPSSSGRISASQVEDAQFDSGREHQARIV